MARTLTVINLQLCNHLVSLLHPGDGVVDKLLHHGLCGLLLVDDGSGLTHEVRSVLLQGILVKLGGVVIIAAHELVQVGLVGDGALGSELLHLSLAVGLPVIDVVIVADTHGPAGEDDGANVVIVASGLDGVLVGLGGAGLIGEDEAGADPDGVGAHHERSGEQLAVVDAAGGDDMDGASGERRLGLAADFDDGRDEHRRGDVAGVAAALAALGADDIYAEVKALFDVLHVSDHVHVDDAGLVKLVYHGLGGNADGGDEELGSRLDDDVDELIELALGVVVAKSSEYQQPYKLRKVHNARVNRATKR